MVKLLSRNNILLVILLLVCGASFAQRSVPSAYDTTATINYVRIWDVITPDTVSTHINVETAVDKARMNTQYHDGLGRIVQTVMKKNSLATDSAHPSSIQNAKDMVVPVEYDAFGREQFKYLPFVANTAGGNTSTIDGLFKLNPFAEQASFYSNTNSANPIKGQGETYFYQQSVFEASPLNRTLNSYAVGNNWVGSSRGVETQYSGNTVSDSVRLWTIGPTISGVPTTSLCYAAGELYKSINIDEHGNKAVEYKDKDQRTILKKVQLASTPGTAHVGWLCTYYVYNDLGNLCFVLSPMAVELLLYSGSWTISTTIRDELCFYYGYNASNQMTVKKVPGAGEVYMVYDARDRLVMTQDSNMRISSKWLVTIYDGLNRSVQTGLVSNSTIGSKSFASHLSDAANSTAYPFDLGSIPGSGYEELTQTGYDDYNNLPSGAPAGSLATTYITSTNFITSYSVSPEYAEEVAQSDRTRGLLTWSKVKVVGTSSTYLYGISIYDEKARLIQVKSTNISGGVDTLTNQYDFAGKLLRNCTAHNKAGTNAHRYYVLTKNSYDGLQRLIAISKRVNRDASTSTSDKTIVKNYYDELGQLKVKKIGSDPLNTSSPLETMNYEYNIRGWMLGANRDYARSASSTANFFGFDLGYDKTGITPAGGSSIGNYASAQYNGNITGMVWKSTGDDQVRKYDFTYDAINRLTAADFNQYTGSAFNKTARLDFSVKNLSFDANGNILTMDQRGWKVGGSITIDSLAYTYNTSSNRLLNVVDKANETATKLGDFRSSSLYMTALDGSKTSSATDYTYDGNGNLIKDLNKDIITYAGADGIEYNYLNLPQKITVKASGSSNKGTIEYTYDATGTKLKKVTTEGSLVTTTLYLFGNYINDTLQYLSQEEGRIRYNEDSSQFNYDYFLKDHLGNVRMVLTEERKINTYPAATMEAADSTVEDVFYANLNTTRSSLPSGYPTDTYTPTNAMVAKLNGGSGGQKIGPSIVLKVMAGDQFNLRVSDWYKLNGTTPSSPSPITDLATILASSLGGAMGAKATPSEITSSGVLSTGVTSFFSSQSDTSIKPKAYINWIAFDEQFNYDAGSSGSQPVGADNTLNIHQLSGMSMKKSGYLYIYVSNETPNIDVFFDNLQLTHIRGPLLEETHYYPFGLTMAGISSRAVAFGNPENKNKFNKGSELQHKEFVDGSGLEWYATNFRSLDPQLGRWWQTDSKPDYKESMYSAMSNNPILYNDALGDTLAPPPHYNWTSEDVLTGGILWSGKTTTDAANLRNEYISRAGKLERSDKLGRASLKEEIRAKTPEPFKEIIERGRPMAEENAKVADPNFQGNALKTNVEVNKAMATTGVVGKGLLIYGAVQSGIKIATSDHPVQETVSEGAGWAGAIYVGGRFAAMMPGHPYLKFGAGLVGGAIGFIGGKKAGDAFMSIGPAISQGARDFYNMQEKARNGGVDQNGMPIPIVCFAEGTLVNTITGLRAIETISQGDSVYSTDIENNKITANLVTKTFKRESASFYILRIGEDTIKVTAEHPVFVLNKGWIHVKNLTKGDVLRTDNSSGIEIEEISKVNKKILVYNIEVDGNHNYFVTQDHILVHNKYIQ
jgi:RHS repeat-associated protein